MSFGGGDSDIIEEIYLSATSPKALVRGLSLIVERAGASGGNIHVVEKTTLASVLFAPHGPNYTPERIDAYFRQWRHVNIHRAAMRRTGGVFLCHEQLSDETLAKAPYAQDFYFRMGERWLAGAVAHSDPDYEVSLVLNREKGAPRFDDSTKALIADLLPHVRRAASLAANAARHNAASEGLAMGLSTSHRPAWLVDASLKLCWANSAAESMLAGDGLVSMSNGRILVHDPAAQSRLEALVTAAAARSLEGAAAQAMRIFDANMTLELEVLPATVPDGALRGVRSLVMVLGRPIGLSAEAAQHLRERFGLTATEAHLAVDIARGIELEAIALQRTVSLKTVRTQLRAVFSKAGVTRQAELAALVWTLSG